MSKWIERKAYLLANTDTGIYSTIYRADPEKIRAEQKRKAGWVMYVYFIYISEEDQLQFEQHGIWNSQIANAPTPPIFAGVMRATSDEGETYQARMSRQQ